MKISRLLPFLVVALFATFSFSSCNRFEGSQEIPSYIYVDKFLLTTNYAIEGSASHNITDVWVYVDDDLRGCYELPATVPLLDRGKHKISLYPGIKLNGISKTRVVYPFYKPYIVEDFELEEKRVDTLHPSVTYYSADEGSTITFRYIEDFERTVSLENDEESDTTIIRTERDDAGNWNDAFNNSHYSGYVWLGETPEGDTIDYFCLLSEEYKDLPNQGNNVMLEIDYKCDEVFQVGLQYKISGVVKYPLYNVNPSQTWNKIYLNLGPRITELQEAEWFKFYITGSTAPGSESEFYFDNIKLIYRD